MLLKPFAPGNRQRAAAPEKLKRGFRRVPVPPATAAFLFILAHVRRTTRSVVANMVQDRFEPSLKPVAPPIAPTRFPRLGVAAEPHVPMRIKLQRNHRRIMGPVLEQGIFALIETCQMFGPVRGATRIKDHVMGACNGIDTVKLHKAKPLDQSQKVFPSGCSTGLFSQRLTIKKQPARRLVVKPENRQGSASFQRIAKGDFRAEGDHPVDLAGRFLHRSGNNSCCLASNLQTAGIHGCQLSWQAL